MEPTEVSRTTAGGGVTAGNALLLSWCPGVLVGGWAQWAGTLALQEQRSGVALTRVEPLVFHGAGASSWGSRQKRSISWQQAQEIDKGEEDRQ